MAVGDLITAARYNNAQGRVAAVLGVGSGTQGYGQTVTSSQVNSNLKVTATDVNNLYTDLKAIRIHQTGGVPNSIATVDVGDTIGDAASDGNALKGFADYESFITLVEADAERFKLASTQQSDDIDVKVAQRRNQWTAPIKCEFQVTFNNADHRRHFFNSGGSITLISSISNPPVSGNSVAKTQNWQAILSNSGTVSFNYQTTTTTGTGITQAIGNYQLTSSYQEIFAKSATGVYGANNYYIRAKAVSSKSIKFEVEFYDHNPGGYKIDEPVQGLLESKIGYVRASGLYVDVAVPAFAITDAL
jgi:hypothetical protein